MSYLLRISNSRSINWKISKALDIVPIEKFWTYDLYQDGPGKLVNSLLPIKTNKYFPVGENSTMLTHFPIDSWRLRFNIQLTILNTRMDSLNPEEVGGPNSRFHPRDLGSIAEKALLVHCSKEHKVCLMGPNSCTAKQSRSLSNSWKSIQDCSLVDTNFSARHL